MSTGTSRLGRGVAIVAVGGAVLGLGVLAWAGLRPGPLAFAEGTRVSLAAYDSDPTGLPEDYSGEMDPVSYGAYMQTAADCEACHTVPGGQPFAGGRPFVTDFGTLYAPNITPDRETGIGDWSDADFLRAMHDGVGKGGKPLYPAFPYAAYAYMSDSDVLALKAYLFSLPPVHNEVPENSLSFPFNQRALMRIWSALYTPGARFEPIPEQGAAWNRGAYLVEALGHCGDCHTPRTPLQSLDNRRKFQGGLAEGWRAYNITADAASGIGDWSDEALTAYLRTGRSSTHGSAFGQMAEAVHLSLARLTSSDIDAVVTYLRSVPALASPDLPAPRTEPAPLRPSEGVPAGENRRGPEIFAATCAGCHKWSGSGALVENAKLTGNRSVNDPTAVNVALAVMQGASALPSSGIATMPAYGAILSDADIAAVANYVTARFGAEGAALSAEDVQALRAAHAGPSVCCRSAGKGMGGSGCPAVGAQGDRARPAVPVG